MKWLHWRSLPRNADPIQAEWPIKEGGVRAYAWTDGKGTAYLCLKTLNRIGKVAGAPDWLRRQQLKSDVVVGFIGERPLVMRVRIEVTRDGLELTVSLPPSVKKLRGFMEKRFTPWKSETPTFSIEINPTLDHYAVKSFPSK
jgi:hypothetical protein